MMKGKIRYHFKVLFNCKQFSHDPVYSFSNRPNNTFPTKTFSHPILHIPFIPSIMFEGEIFEHQNVIKNSPPIVRKLCFPHDLEEVCN